MQMSNKAEMIIGN